MHHLSEIAITRPEGEELDDDTIVSLFEAARWAPSPSIINHGDLSMLKEIQNIGVLFDSCNYTFTPLHIY